MSSFIVLMMILLGTAVAFQSRQLRVMTNSRVNKEIQLTTHNLVVGQGIIAGYIFLKSLSHFIYSFDHSEHVQLLYFCM